MHQYEREQMAVIVYSLAPQTLIVTYLLVACKYSINRGLAPIDGMETSLVRDLLYIYISVGGSQRQQFRRL